ncbi:MAG: hypothetical protein GXP49_04240 [Deltaproteobacteria bacterium]|nr:hypothetical protein [Deltaproteobacteria bacterium]
MRFSSLSLLSALGLAFSGLWIAGCGQDQSRNESALTCDLTCRVDSDCYYQQICDDNGCCRSVQDRSELKGYVESKVVASEKEAKSGSGECTIAGSWRISRIPLYFNSGIANGTGAYVETDEKLGKSLVVLCWTRVSEKDEYMLKAFLPLARYKAGAEIATDEVQARVELTHDSWELDQSGNKVPGSSQSILEGVSYEGTATVSADKAGSEIGQAFRVDIDTNIAQPFGPVD